MKKEILATSVLLGLTALALHARNKPLETVKYVELKKYLGTWFEIAAIPQIFEKGCICTSATYGLDTDGTLIVKNRCIKDDKLKITEGRAFIADNSNAKLNVQFFWPFKAKYWIIDLAKDYSYAVVGHPDRKSLWILSRRPTLDEHIYDHLVVRAANKGFDVRQLVKTEQIADVSGI
ncbi:lipocalin family protein [Mucilaginibacter pocheonensis]|uniref:Apolipoprotein D and lipocalin family protein n=1 Tax=Mucilaginibacter pocheonensis TaxID=398050 RepID=A0ABU1T6F0_9SPHI|nr:lipocalin family protein [Mucilaginibacter pocheonensis]MDR6940864.1 apolipoprotein D and lipocalin family protein [Mucilaginibacter pocheonensis]